MINRILAFSIQNRWLVIMRGHRRSARWAPGTSRACRSTRCRTSPTSRCRSTPRRRATRRWRSSSASPSRSKRRWADLPKLDYTRSLSRYGLSQVTVVFKDGTDIYFARQLVNERIQQAKEQLPPGTETAMGPVSTGLGEIYMYAVEAKPGAKRPDGEPYSADRPAHHPGLDHQAAASHRARHRRGQHDRRLREASSTCCPIPRS